jgi:hypothetical protein
MSASLFFEKQAGRAEVYDDPDCSYNRDIDTGNWLRIKKPL